MMKKKKAMLFAAMAFLTAATMLTSCGSPLPAATAKPSEPAATAAVTPGGSPLPVGESGVTISVVDCGANPKDDGADDTKAVQDALDKADMGDVVYFPDGVYNISSVNVSRTDIQLIGQSQDGAVLQFCGGKATGGMLSIEGATGVTVSKLTLTAKMDVKVKAGILAANSKELNINHVTIKDFSLDTSAEDDSGPHGILFTGDDDQKNGVTKSVISDCTITNIGVNSLWGAGIRIAKGSSGNTVEHNTLSDFGRGGILCNDGSEKLVIRNNTIRNCGLWDDPEVEGIHDGEPLGIELFGGCNSGIVEDNDVDHWISVACDSDFCAVRRNKIGDSNALAYSWCQLELAEAGYSVFTDNVAGSGAQTGISMSNSLGDTPIEYALFARNKITDPAMFGINIDGQGDSIRGVYFYDNDVSDAKADRDHSEAPGYQGVGVAMNGCGNITFENCRFVNNERYGVRIMPPDNEVDNIRFLGCTISGSGKAFVHNDKDPILQYQGYTAFEFRGGKVTGNGDDTLPAEKASANKAPVAIMNAPATAVVGEHIQFSSASHDPDGKIGHVLWDFGAGTPMISQRPVIAYDKAGTYTVTLIVWDDKGSASRLESKITVTENTSGEVPGKSLLLSANPKIESVSSFIADNLALNKPVTCSEGIEDGCVPEQAVDGSIGYPEWGSLTKGDKWLVVDLEKECKISRYVVYNISNAGDPVSMNTKDFRIQKSSDGKSWEDVDVVKGNAEPTVDKVVPPFTARYVRLLIETPAQDPAETEGRILEFQLFENPEPPKPAAPAPESVVPYPKALEQTLGEFEKSSGKITRAEFAMMVAQMLQTEAEDGQPYDDIAGDAHRSEILQLKAAGILPEKSGNFRPGDQLTNEEAAAILTNAYLYLAKGALENMKYSSEARLSDGDKADAAALESLKFACVTGLIPTDATGAAHPKDGVTKAQAAKMIQALYTKFVEEEIIF